MEFYYVLILFFLAVMSIFGAFEEYMIKKGRWEE
jgi:hypothetical protein